MLRYAIDAGVNYVDTAWPYHGGESEELVGAVLEGELRRKVLLATKMPIWEIKRPEDMDRVFAKQLEKLRTDYVDFYLLHALNKAHFKTVVDTDMVAWAEKQKRDGRIRYLGFSFHDELSLFREIVDYYDGWDFTQIQYNYMNEKDQAGTAGLKYAVEHDLAVVVMEPLLGGSLAETPDAVSSVFARAKKDRTPVEWALDWLWDKQEIGTVLSGLSSMQQVEEDVLYATRSSVGMLSDEERALFRDAKNAYESLHPVPCTQCRYCMPCPHGVDIPGNFDIFNTYYKFGNREEAVARYNRHMPEAARASACIRCNECLPKCPQSIQIPDCLEQVDKELAEAV